MKFKLEVRCLAASYESGEILALEAKHYRCVLGVAHIGKKARRTGKVAHSFLTVHCLPL